MTGPGNARLSGSADVLNAEVSGSGDLEAGQLKVRNAVVKGRGPGGIALAGVSDTLDADLSGSGGLEAAMAGKRLLLRMDGPGDARIEGTVEQVNAQLSGSGSLEARRLLAGQADIQVHGPGNAEVNVVDKGGKPDERRTMLTVDRRGTTRSVEQVW